MSKLAKRNRETILNVDDIRNLAHVEKKNSLPQCSILIIPSEDFYSGEPFAEVS
jgi:hypothetical protein